MEEIITKEEKFWKRIYDRFRIVRKKGNKFPLVNEG